MGARHPRGMLKACIELVRSCRLTEIESLCAHVNGNNDLMILGRNVAGRRACTQLRRRQGPTGHSCELFWRTYEIPQESALIVRFIDNESPGAEMDTCIA